MIEEIKKILDEPVVTTDGGLRYIDENHKRYLASQIVALMPKGDEKGLLTNKEIGDLLDLESEFTYPCSGGGLTTTIDVHPVLKAQQALSEANK